MHLRTFTSSLLTLSLLCSSATAVAQSNTSPYLDMEPEDFGYDAAMYLREKGIMKGYENATFRPDASISRAEALKILAFPLISPADEKVDGQTSDFADVENGVWYLPYVNWGVKNNVINGPAVSENFRPENPVKKAEFLKMLFLAYKVDPNAFGEVQLPLAVDVANPKEWYYPYARYGVSSSVLVLPKSGTFSLNRTLTRIDVAVLLHRYLLYKQGLRTQFLLDSTSGDIVNALDALEKNDLRKAEYASARALLAARGAHASMPEEKPVKVAVKTAEAIRALVRAYRAWVNEDAEQVIKLSSDSWFLADQARKITPDATVIAEQIMKYAGGFADSARKRK